MNLLQLTGLVCLFNLMTFGNGPVMVPLLQTHLVEGSGVLSSDQLLYAFAIARVTPGPANLYVTSVGYMLFGLAGALLTTLAITLPGYLMLPLLKGYDLVRTSRIVQGFTKGLAATSVGLIAAATLQIGHQTLTGLIPWLIFPLTLVLNQYFKLNPVLCLAIACPVGLGLKLLLG